MGFCHMEWVKRHSCTCTVQGVYGHDIQVVVMMSIGHIPWHTLLDGYVPKNRVGGGLPT